TLADGRSLRYVYDEVGGQPQQAGAQQLRRIDLYSSAGVLQGTEATLNWDAAGNLIAKSGAGYSQSLAWDADGHLRQSVTQVSTGTTSSTYDERYGYDAAGRRLVRQMQVGGTLYVSQFLYSGEDIVKEYGASWGLPVAAYTHGAGTDEALLMQGGAGTRYYHADGLGTPGLLTDEAGATYAWRRHDAWGRNAGGAGTMPLYGYAGREPDLSSGLIHMRARYYDPALGRFISRDPIGLAGGLNVYAYVGNDPVNCTDPSGLFAKSVGNTLQGLGNAASQYYDRASAGPGSTRQNGATVTYRSSPYPQDTTGTMQTALSLASAIPVVGIPFSLIGAAMDLDGGHYGSAALNLVSAIPVVGILRGVGRTADVLLDAGRVANAAKGFSSNVNAVRNAVGKGNNITVGTQREAEAILQQARPNIPWRETYGPKTKVGAEVHPVDGSGIAPGRQVELPHIKWRDWSGGKGAGAEGHIYFDSVNGGF
ncbi:MAG: RHS repeat-associated core domain-containing protein, partial [Burkholderiaceae bacterium]|nr:RHS repeat-associated core domain-containing protein [Burkholderiaceae bacterium]